MGEFEEGDGGDVAVHIAASWLVMLSLSPPFVYRVVGISITVTPELVNFSM